MTESIEHYMWKIVRLVVEEAMNRYGLMLFGNVRIRGVVFEVVFVCLEIMTEFSQEIDPKFLTNDHDAAVFAEFGVYPSLRKLAEKRDTNGATK